jgi:hypothetical protein
MKRNYNYYSHLDYDKNNNRSHSNIMLIDDEPDLLVSAADG